MLSKIETLRHIAFISQGAIHPFALWRTRNGTLGAILKVHSASRLRAFSERKESPGSMSKRANIPPAAQLGKTYWSSETSLTETTVQYAEDHGPGVKLRSL